MKIRKLRNYSIKLFRFTKFKIIWLQGTLNLIIWLPWHMVKIKIVILWAIINKSSTQQVVEISCMFLFRLAAFCDTLFHTITILLVSKKKCRTKLQCIKREKSFSKEFSSFKIRFCLSKVFMKKLLLAIYENRWE